MAGAARAETIRLKSGRVIEGTVVARTADAVKVDTGIGIPITYYLDEIENIPAAPPVRMMDSDQSLTSPAPAGLPAPAMETSPSAPAAAPQPPLKTPAPKQPIPVSSPVPHKTGKEMELYAQATTPAPPPAGPLNKDDYLRIQFERANALLKEDMLKVIESLKERVTREWRNFKDSHAVVKNLAEGPAGIPMGAGLWAGVYALLCFPLARIARRLQAGSCSWMAWVPILQIFLVIRIAEKSPVWFLFFFFPGANLFAFLFVWMSIARRLEQSHRLGYLMLVPGVNLFVLWYLALLPIPAPPKPQDSTDTGIRFE